jgi:hypothetical protein
MIENKPRQKWFLTLGETGCYFLSILHAAERVTGQYIDAFAAFMLAISKGMSKENCFITDPAGLLSYLTGEKWAVSKEDWTYQCTGGEVEILRYEWQDVGVLRSHFVVGNCRGDIEYDSLGESNTVKNGKCVSKRIFRRTS